MKKPKLVLKVEVRKKQAPVPEVVPMTPQEQALSHWREFYSEKWHAGEFSAINLYDPEFTADGGLSFGWAYLGYLWDGMFALIPFTRWLRETDPAFDFKTVPLYIRMNDHLWPVLPDHTLEICKEYVERTQREQREAYEKTPEFASREAARLKLHTQNAEAVKAVLADLRNDFSHLQMALWLLRYIPAADAVGGEEAVDMVELNSRFEQMGYVRNAGVHDPYRAPVGFYEMIRYVVGQLMALMTPIDPERNPIAVHPVLVDRVKEALQTLIPKRRVSK